MHLLNTSIIPSAPGSWSVRVSPLSLAEARELVRATTGPLISHVGHESTAQIMSTLLGVTVPFDRTPMRLDGPATALVFQLRGRPPEGAILSAEEIERYGYDFRKLHFEPEAD